MTSDGVHASVDAGAGSGASAGDAAGIEARRGGHPTIDRLSALDEAYLDAETPTLPLHLGAVVTLEAGPLIDRRGRLRLGAIRAHVEGRLGAVPRFRRHPRQLPLGLGRPIWVDDEDFDITRHVRSVRLGRPGSDGQLRELAAELLATPLDRAHPLWELWLVSGLSDDRVGMVEKIHHALADGVSGVDVTAVILDPSPGASVGSAGRRGPDASGGTAAGGTAVAPSGRTGRGWCPAPPPGSARLAADALAGSLDTATSLWRTSTALRGLVGPFGLAPACSLNRAVGPRRRYLAVRRTLAELGPLRSRSGATVNDVVLAAVAGGVGRLLRARGETVRADLALRVLVPVSVRATGERLAAPNRTAALIVELPVGDTDPLRRLQSVSRSTRRAKEGGGAEATGALLGLMDLAPVPLVGLVSRLVVHHQPLVNLVVTNIPGPPEPLYLLGARMLEAVPVVPLGGNLSVGVAALSYDGQLTIGIHADPDACPDLDRLASAVGEGFDELLAAAG